jgi:hypothetical protein
VELLGPVLRAAIRAACAESNARVARDLLGRADGRLFADEPAEGSGPDEAVACGAADLAAMMDAYLAATARPKRWPLVRRRT